MTQHYENTPMQYTAIFKVVKKNPKIFSRICFAIFLIFAQNGEAILTSTHNLCFGAKIRKIGIYPCVPPSSTIKKWGSRGYTFHGHVFLISQKCCVVIHLSSRRDELLVYGVHPSSVLRRSHLANQRQILCGTSWEGGA